MANRRFIDFPIASTVGDNDIILIWQDGLNKQTTKATLLSGLPEDLADLNDVVISGLTNGQILRYNSTTGVWENTDQGNLDLTDLNDVTIVSPSNGQVLVYNSSTSQWENSSGGFVPYVGAVTTVDLGAQGLRAGYVRFDTTIASVPNEQGLMYWDDSRSTAALIMNGTLQHIGQDTFFYVKNSSGSTIPKGTCVRFAGTDGASGHLLVVPFLANGSVPSTYFMGVTAEEITNGSFGQVMHFGELTGIDTSGFAAGSLLYASSTVAGAFQTTAPTAPNNIVLVAAAVNSKNNGAIVVRPTYGSNINDDEGVKITSPTTGQLLQLQASGLWENKTLAQVLGGTSSQFVKGDGSLDSTSYGTGTVTSVGLSSATSGVTIGSSPVTTSGTITLAIATASGSQNGLLSSTDWTTFNGKQNALTNPVTGTGTTNYLPKFTGSTTIGNSLVFDNGTNVGIGTASPAVERKLTVAGGAQFTFASNSGASFNIVPAANGQDGADFNLSYYTGSAYGPLNFIVGESNRLRINPNGNVLIGTTTDVGARLYVNGQIRADNFAVQRASAFRGGLYTFDAVAGTGTDYSVGIFSEGEIFLAPGGSATKRMSMTNAGAVTFSSLGTGTVYSNGGTLTNTNPSDFNLKQNIAPINYGLGEILQLNPVTFNWKNDTINQGKQYGFIAQEVQKIMPDLVKKGEYLGLDKEAIFTTLVKAIQELKAEIDTLKN